ncbi:hypothetical protein [Trueperella bialowiezensis]|uniref:DUF7973 domain-containing protein n=1 Tax=Trueperella bialowiezensis TaxID=312285 RepID=A0A3S4UZI6_9ACTO|nr:hypothetical protein [Trueperella bialowiezensis]VEI13619.1 Uncharacterised protein [Trueperella bialowiezensis]
MEIDLFWLVAAFGGGAFGAALGGQTAFTFTGIMYLVGLGTYMAGADAGPYMDSVVFGPVFGPHISFVGGVAAAAYAAKVGAMPKGVNGRDIVSPLAGLARSDVLMVGGIFGVLGYLLNNFFAWILPVFKAGDPALHFGNEAIGATDTVALTIIVLSIVIRYMFGNMGLFQKVNGIGLLEVGEGKHWVEHQEKWGVTAAHGLTTGLMSAFATLVVVQKFFEAQPGIVNHAQLIGWAVSAFTLLFLTLGVKTPVTHHMTILASIAALKFMPIIAGTSAVVQWSSTHLAIATIIGGVVGALGGLWGELLARVSNSNGDTHIDPPAFAIFTGTTLLYAITAIAA